MRASRVRLLPLLVVAALAACSSNDERPEYQGAQYYKNLEIPPDLTLAKTQEGMEIPQPSKSALAEHQASSKLDYGVLPQFKGIRLESDGDRYWLEADVAPDTVWPKLESFWEHEGIRLLQDEPQLGFMETEWTSRLVVDPDAGFITRMFAKLEPDQLDRFRMRVETNDDHTLTRVSVSHAGKEMIVEGNTNDVDSTISWRRLPSDPDLEREILARLLLFAGLTEDQKDSMLNDYKPYSSYVHYTKHEEKKTYAGEDEAKQVTELTMDGSMDFVWERTLRALDRLQLSDIKPDRASARIHFTSGSDIELVKDDEPRDEIAESSWLNRLLSGSGKEESKKSKQFTLLLSEQGSSVRLQLLDDKDQPATSIRAEQLKQALAQELD